MANPTNLPKLAHIKNEPQAMWRIDWVPKGPAGTGNNTWFYEERHMADPMLFIDLIARYTDHDQYFYVVLMLLMFGLVLM